MKTNILFLFLLMSTTLFAQKSILFLGDSYTSGTGVKPEDSYPVLLMQQLKKAGKNYTSSTIARGGWTSDELLSALPKFDKPQYDKVIVMIGTNNQFRKYNQATYLQDINRIVERVLPACKHGLKSITLLTTPDYTIAPYVANFPEENPEMIANWNNALEKLCAKKGIKTIDIETLSKQAKGHPEMFAKDGLHFSKIMYQLWAEMIVKEVKF